MNNQTTKQYIKTLRAFLKNGMPNRKHLTVLEKYKTLFKERYGIDFNVDYGWARYAVEFMVNERVREGYLRVFGRILLVALLYQEIEEFMSNHVVGNNIRRSSQNVNTMKEIERLYHQVVRMFPTLQTA